MGVVAGSGKGTSSVNYTDKKEKKILVVYKEFGRDRVQSHI
jgi:hypothetical protein